MNDGCLMHEVIGRQISLMQITCSFPVSTSAKIVSFFYVTFAHPSTTDAFCKTCIPVPLFKILTWLGYFNSAMNPVIYSIFNTEFRDAFKRILISYAHNECCDRRRESRGAMDLLVGGKRCPTRYSTSEAGAASPHHPQKAKLVTLPSSQSLGVPGASTGMPSPGRQYQSMTGNHQLCHNRETLTPTIEVMQDKSIELSFFPAGNNTMDQKEKISAI